MKKALITASVFGFIGSFEKSNINILLEQGYEVHVAANMSKELEAFGDIGQLDGINIIKHQIAYSRSPLSLQTIKSYKAIKNLIKKENFDLIHCHTPVAAMLTRLASIKVRKKGTKVIYTAHGFHFFKGSPLLNWLIYFPVEWFCSFFTDILITINQEDYRFAQKVMRGKQVEYVPGVGVDVEKFKSIQVDKVLKRKQLGIPQNAIMLLSVGELNKNKNHEVIIEALGRLKNPNVYYCIAGQGDLEDYLKNKARLLGIQNQVYLLGFRTDINELCQVADIFCFPSYREGLGLAAIEALSVGKPLITSTTRGINDYSIDGLTGYKSPDYSVDGFTDAIQRFLDNEIIFETEELKKHAERFHNTEVNKIMTKIYKEVNIYGK